MSDDERVLEIARRGQLSPESLTEDEIRLIALAVLSDLQGGDFPAPERPSQN